MGRAVIYKERCGECGARYQDRQPLRLLAKRKAHEAWHDERDQLDAAADPEHHAERFSPELLP